MADDVDAPTAPDATTSSGPSSKADNWVHGTFGVHPGTFATPTAAADDDAGGGMTGVTPDGAPYSAPGTAPDSSQAAPAPPPDGGGGSTAVTPDGAPYSAPGTAPDSSQAAPAAPADGGGGMTGVTPDGAPYSAPGTAPDSSQAAPAAPADGGGGMTGVTPDGAPYSAPGTAPDSSQTTPEAAPPADSDERNLNSGEISYAHDIFQDTLDYGVITITRGAVASTGSTRTVGNTINFESSEFVPGTFDLTPDGKNTLIHEMTHVWQYQHQGWTYAPAALWAQFKSTVTTGSRDGAYDWRSLDKAGTAWDQWNPEAQAEAVEDYNKALRTVQAGSGAASDYGDLNLLQKYINQMVAGPPKDGGSAGADGGAGGAPPGDGGTAAGASSGASTDGSAGATGDGSGATSPTDGQGGMTGVTPDGAPYSAQGTAPDSAQTTPAAPPQDGDGGMTGVTPDGAPYSAPGSAPDSSQSMPSLANGAGQGTGQSNGAVAPAPASGAAGAASPPPAAASDAMQAKLKLLTPKDIAACNAYLDAHFDALLTAGAAGTKPGDYQPALDGKAVQLADVIDALLPLTLFGSSAADSPALADGRSETRSELFDLVSSRSDSVVADKISNAGPGAQPTPGNRVLRIPPDLLKPPTLGDADGWTNWRKGFDAWQRQNTIPPGAPPPAPALPDWFWKPQNLPAQPPEWQTWRENFKKWSEDHHLDTKPIIDSVKNASKVEDDGADDPNRPRKVPDGKPDDDN